MLHELQEAVPHDRFPRATIGDEVVWAGRRMIVVGWAQGILVLQPAGAYVGHHAPDRIPEAPP